LPELRLRNAGNLAEEVLTHSCNIERSDSFPDRGSPLSLLEQVAGLIDPGLGTGYVRHVTLTFIGNPPSIAPAVIERRPVATDSI